MHGALLLPLPPGRSIGSLAPAGGRRRAVVALCAAAWLAAWLDFGHMQRHLTSDGVVPVLVSLWRWRPYFWQQDRYGMLWPLLAAPFDQPLVNLLLVVGLNVCAGLLAPFALARYLLGPRSAWVEAGLLAAALLVGLPPPSFSAEMVSSAQFTSSAVALGCVALSLARRGGHRWAWGFVPMALACWVNWSIPVLLGALALPQPRLWASLRRSGGNAFACDAWRQLAVGCAGAVVGLAGKQVAGSHEAGGWLPLRLWGLTANRLGRHVWAALGPDGPTATPWALPAALVVCGVALPLAAVVMAPPRSRATARRPALALGAAACGCVVYTGLVCTQAWTARNDYAFRYGLPAVLCLTAIAAAAAATCLPRRPAGSGRRWAALLLVGTLAATHRFGWPSLAAVRADLNVSTGRHTPAVLAAGCTHVAGSYGAVWPAAFHATWRHRSAGNPSAVFGIAPRMAPTRQLWDPDPSHWRICLLDVTDDALPDIARRVGVSRLRLRQPTGALPVGEVAEP